MLAPVHPVLLATTATTHPSLLGLLLLLLIGLTVALTAGVILTVRTLRRPPRRGYAWALARSRPAEPSEIARPDASRGEGAGRGGDFETWTITSPAGELPVWDLRGEVPGGPVIIVTHGWGESRVVALGRAAHLLALASRVVLWDLPGHGEAPGATSLGAREHEDLLTLIERVRATDADAQVVLFGSSLGAGVSIAASVRSGGAIPVIAEAPYRVPFTPARNVLRQAGYPWRVTLPLSMAWLGVRLAGTPKWASPRARIAFDRAGLSATLRAPLLVIVGERDAVSPVEDARAIAEAAPSGELLVVEGAGHLDLWEGANLGPSLDGVRGFIDRSIATP